MDLWDHARNNEKRQSVKAIIKVKQQVFLHHNYFSRRVRVIVCTRSAWACPIFSNFALSHIIKLLRTEWCRWTWPRFIFLRIFCSIMSRLESLLRTPFFRWPFTKHWPMRHNTKDLTPEQRQCIVDCLLHDLKREADETVGMDGQLAINPGVHKTLKSYIIRRV